MATSNGRRWQRAAALGTIKPPYQSLYFTFHSSTTRHNTILSVSLTQTASVNSFSAQATPRTEASAPHHSTNQNSLPTSHSTVNHSSSQTATPPSFFLFTSHQPSKSCYNFSFLLLSVRSRDIREAVSESFIQLPLPSAAPSFPAATTTPAPPSAQPRQPKLELDLHVKPREREREQKFFRFSCVILACFEGFSRTRISIPNLISELHSWFWKLKAGYLLMFVFWIVFEYYDLFCGL
nr:uncharacterized protein LOC113710102 [Coffea arabica]